MQVGVCICMPQGSALDHLVFRVGMQSLHLQKHATANEGADLALMVNDLETMTLCIC